MIYICDALAWCIELFRLKLGGWPKYCLADALIKPHNINGFSYMSLLLYAEMSADVHRLKCGGPWCTNEIRSSIIMRPIRRHHQHHLSNTFGLLLFWLLFIVYEPWFVLCPYTLSGARSIVRAKPTMCECIKANLWCCWTLDQYEIPYEVSYLTIVLRIYVSKHKYEQYEMNEFIYVPTIASVLWNSIYIWTKMCIYCKRQDRIPTKSDWTDLYNFWLYVTFFAALQTLFNFEELDVLFVMVYIFSVLDPIFPF